MGQKFDFFLSHKISQTTKKGSGGHGKEKRVIGGKETRSGDSAPPFGFRVMNDDDDVDDGMHVCYIYVCMTMENI